MNRIMTLSLIALFLVSCADKNAGAPANAPAILPVLDIAYATASTETEYPVAIEATPELMSNFFVEDLERLLNIPFQ